MKKKILSVCAIVCALAMCLPLAACSDKRDDGAAASFVGIDINPSIELTLDAKNRVISVSGANEDGQVLLYGESGIIGESAEKAVEKITKLAVELGYLDNDNSVVLTNVTSAKKGKADDILKKINAKITATAGESNLSVTTSGEQAYSVLRSLENVKKQYPDSSAVQALTPEKFRLAVSATETGEISVEAAAKLSEEELIKLVSDAHASRKEYATKAYNEAVIQAETAYSKIVNAATDGIFTTYYTLHRPLNAYYGVSYHGFKLNAEAMRLLSEGLFYIEKVKDYPLSPSQTEAVCAALGLSDAKEIENSDGEVTVSSIEAYADKKFKNSATAAELNKMKQDLTAALNEAETEIGAKVDELSKKYETEIAAVKEAAEKAVENLKKYETLVPGEVKQQLGEMVSDFEFVITESVNIVKDGRITADEVRAFSEDLNEKAQSVYKKIESDLSESELEEVNKLQQTAIDGINGAKQAFDKAVADAEASAREALGRLKEARKTKAE